MSGNQSTETTLTQSDHFEFSVKIEDPDTGLEFNFPMEVDTGCPYALALPDSCENFFSRKQGTLDLGGAGSAQSPVYSADINQVGNIQLDYNTFAVITLEKSYSYGLLGIELLKHLQTKISGEPNSKKLRLEKTHL